MASKEDCLDRNRAWARDAIKASRGLEAVSSVSDNICFSVVEDHSYFSSDDIKILKDALENCDIKAIENRVASDISYAHRIANGSDLEPEEVDLIFSLVGGALTKIIALREAEAAFELSDTQLDWIRDDILTRDDIAPSEERMARAYPLYLNTSVLLEAYLN